MPTALLELLTALVGPFTAPASRTWWGSLLVAGLVAAAFAVVKRPGWTWARVRDALRHPSTRLDVQLLLGRQLLRWGFGVGGVGAAWLLATRAVRWLDATAGRPDLAAVPEAVVVALYATALFVLGDLSRYLLHRALHRVPALWALHQVHHSAEVLTPLTFHRLHPLESALYQARGVVVTGGLAALFFYLFRDRASDVTLLGVPVAGLALNAVFGNLRHSHVWLRFPAPVERVLLSPAQHQVHHSAEPRHFDANFGTWLAVWDRLGGSLQVSEDAPPARFGLDAPNHGHDLLSAWFGPLRSSRLAAVLAVAAVLVALGRTARADYAGDAEDAEEGDEDSGPSGAEIIVTPDDRPPRVAGSAHEVSEESLEQFEYDNIEQVLTAEVPGVTTRSEDGFGLRPNIGIRGANSDRSAKITLMEDGVLFAPAPYAAPAAYYFPMSTRLVGVEVFKGAAATRHGPHTVGGAINVLTREVPRSGTDYQLDVSGGMRGAAKAHGYVGVGGDRTGLLAEVVHLRSGGFKTIDFAPDAPTGFDRTEAMLKGRLTPSAAHELQLKLGYGNETSHETYLGLTRADFDADPYRRYAATQAGLMAWNRTQAELSWEADLGDRVRLRTVAYHHSLDRSWTKFNGFGSGIDAHDLLQLDPQAGQGQAYLSFLRGEADTDPGSADQALLIGTNHRTYQSMGVQTLARWEVNTERVSSTLEGGARVHKDVVDRVHDEIAHDMTGGRLERRPGAERVVNTDTRAYADAVAVWLHEDLRVGPVHVLPGGRVESVATSLVEGDPGFLPEGEVIRRTTLLPGLGLLVQAGDYVDIFAGSYRGFSPVAPGQPEEVQPELAWNHEAGVRAGDNALYGELVGFFNDYINLTGACTLSGGCLDDDLDRQFNGGEVHVLGVEAVAGADVLLPGAFTLPVRATWTTTQSVFQTGFVSGFPQFGTVEPGDSLPYVPQHQGSLRVTLKHEVWDLGAGASVRSGMLDEAGPMVIDADDVPPLLLLDMAARVHVRERWTLYATGTNLTNTPGLTSWRPMGARPTAPLQVMVGVKVRPKAKAPAG